MLEPVRVLHALMIVADDLFEEGRLKEIVRLGQEHLEVGNQDRDDAWLHIVEQSDDGEWGGRREEVVSRSMGRIQQAVNQGQLPRSGRLGTLVSSLLGIEVESEKKGSANLELLEEESRDETEPTEQTFKLGDVDDVGYIDDEHEEGGDLLSTLIGDELGIEDELGKPSDPLDDLMDEDDDTEAATGQEESAFNIEEEVDEEEGESDLADSVGMTLILDDVESTVEESLSDEVVDDDLDPVAELMGAIAKGPEGRPSRSALDELMDEIDDDPALEEETFSFSENPPSQVPSAKEDEPTPRELITEERASDSIEDLEEPDLNQLDTEESQEIASLPKAKRFSGSSSPYERKSPPVLEARAIEAEGDDPLAGISDEAVRTYRLLLETVWVDGVLDPAEVALLARKREELGLDFIAHLHLTREMLEE